MFPCPVDAVQLVSAEAAAVLVNSHWEPFRWAARSQELFVRSSIYDKPRASSCFFLFGLFWPPAVRTLLHCMQSLFPQICFFVYDWNAKSRKINWRCMSQRMLYALCNFRRECHSSHPETRHICIRQGSSGSMNSSTVHSISQFIVWLAQTSRIRCLPGRLSPQCSWGSSALCCDNSCVFGSSAAPHLWKPLILFLLRTQAIGCTELWSVKVPHAEWCRLQGCLGHKHSLRTTGQLRTSSVNYWKRTSMELWRVTLNCDRHSTLISIEQIKSPKRGLEKSLRLWLA